MQKHIVVSIQQYKRRAPQGPPPQTPGPKANRVKKHFFINQHVAKSAVKQFLECGQSVREIARKQVVSEKTVEGAVRDAYYATCRRAA